MLNPPPLAPADLAVRDLGLIDYAEAMALQDALVEQRLNGEIPNTLLLLEHPPVITLGRRDSLQDVVASPEVLAKQGTTIHHTVRGGLVTYHGPGQLVGYPILKPRDYGLTLPCYVRALENAIVAALGTLDVDAHIDEQHVGVWTSHGKIAAIGVAQRHGVTLHGFAVNLQPNLDHFQLIDPCGIGELGVTSAAAILGHEVDITKFKRTIADAVQAELAALTVACAH